MSDLTPRAIVSELDRFIIGQKEAKKAVAIALRNRWRRLQLAHPLREEVLPKNILMIGPTGVGKTEISRRLAKLAKAPFIKVEATKFTEIGYVGRDVEQIIRDLVETSIKMVRDTHLKEVQTKADAQAEELILDSLVGENASAVTRETFRQKLKEGQVEDKEIDVELNDTSSSMTSIDLPNMPGASVSMMNLGDLFPKAMGGRKKTRRLTVAEARRVLADEAAEQLLEQEKIVRDAIDAVEQGGIVFIDEIDKICAREEHRGGDVSREGVQRDLLPLIEGTSVSTKHGSVKTDHILFIASGAFHLSKPSDLLPELQGRLPIRVELSALKSDDFRRILTEPEASLIKQYIALMNTEGVILEFTPEAIDSVAHFATKINSDIENIGARRLQTILERVLEEISFTASERSGEKVVITPEDVEKSLGKVSQNLDLGRFIL